MRLRTILVFTLAPMLACRAKSENTTAGTKPLAQQSQAPVRGELSCLALENFPDRVSSGRFDVEDRHVRLLASGESQVIFPEAGPAEASGTFEGTWSKQSGEITYSFNYVNPDPGACQYGCGEEAYNDGKPDPEGRTAECARKCRADALARYGSETPKETITCFVRKSSGRLVTNCTGGDKSGQVFRSAADSPATCAAS
jgi:hypothetical protein